MSARPIPDPSCGCYPRVARGPVLRSRWMFLPLAALVGFFILLFFGVS